MPYVIVDRCTRDGSCVEVCPVACIHTTPDAPQFYIDPEVCIECEQCEVVCPVDAIFLHTNLPEELLDSIEVNAAFFRQNKGAVETVPVETAWQMVHAAHAYAAAAGLTIAVAVVDDAGSPIAVGRMDGAAPTASELALSKAYTAVAFQVATQELVPQAKEPWLRSLMVGSRGRILPAGGGIAISDGVVVSAAIAAAGSGRDEQDILCARAGLGVLAPHGH